MPVFTSVFDDHLLQYRSALVNKRLDIEGERRVITSLHKQDSQKVAGPRTCKLEEAFQVVLDAAGICSQCGLLDLRGHYFHE